MASFGKTTVGTNLNTSSGAKTSVSPVIPASSGTLTAGHFRVNLDTGTGVVHLVVYADAVGLPGALIAMSDPLTVTNLVMAWDNFTFSGTNQIAIVSGTKYHIGAAWPDPGTNIFTYERDNTASQRFEQISDAPSTFGTPSLTSGGPIAVYLDYTVGVTYTAPGSFFDLSNWYLTLPSDDGTGAAKTVNQPALDTYADANFYLDGSNRLVATAPVNGFTTSGSSATRSELREQIAGVNASWGVATANKSLVVSGYWDPTSISGGSAPVDIMIIGQIHATSGTPPIYVTIDYSVTPSRMRLFKDGPGVGNLVTGFTPSDLLTLKIESVGGNLNVYGAIGDETALPGTPQFTFAGSSFVEQTGWYFKSGAYNKTDNATGSSGAVVATLVSVAVHVAGAANAVSATLGGTATVLASPKTLIAAALSGYATVYGLLGNSYVASASFGGLASVVAGADRTKVAAASITGITTVTLANIPITAPFGVKFSRNSQASSGSVGSTPFLILPLPQVNGNLLIAVYAVLYPSSPVAPGVPAGWTVLFSGTQGAYIGYTVAYWRINASLGNGWTFPIAANGVGVVSSHEYAGALIPIAGEYGAQSGYVSPTIPVSTNRSWLMDFCVDDNTSALNASTITVSPDAQRNNFWSTTNTGMRETLATADTNTYVAPGNYAKSFTGIGDLVTRIAGIIAIPPGIGIALGGTGTVTANATQTSSISAAIGGTGTIVANPAPTAVAASIGGTVAVAAAASTLQFASAVIATHAVVTSSFGLPNAIAATLSGAATVMATGTLVAPLQSTISSTCTVLANPAPSDAVANLVGTATIIAAADKYLPVSASISGQTFVATTLGTVWPAAVAVTGAATVSANICVLLTATITSTTSITTGVQTARVVACAIAGTVSVSPHATSLQRVAATIPMLCTVSATAERTRYLLGARGNSVAAITFTHGLGRVPQLNGALVVSTNVTHAVTPPRLRVVILEYGLRAAGRAAAGSRPPRYVTTTGIALGDAIVDRDTVVRSLLAYAEADATAIGDLTNADAYNLALSLSSLFGHLVPIKHHGNTVAAAATTFKGKLIGANKMSDVLNVISIGSMFPDEPPTAARYSVSATIGGTTTILATPYTSYPVSATIAATTTVFTTTPGMWYPVATPIAGTTTVLAAPVNVYAVSATIAATTTISAAPTTYYRVSATIAITTAVFGTVAPPTFSILDRRLAFIFDVLSTSDDELALPVGYGATNMMLIHHAPQEEEESVPESEPEPEPAVFTRTFMVMR
jgi:hypothetical protein